MQHARSAYSYQRRCAREVIVGDLTQGGVVIGGQHPVVKQSMITCDTMDTAACVQQTLELVEVGCQIVRITAPTVKDAANLENIVRERGDSDDPFACQTGGHREYIKPEVGTLLME